MDCGASFKVTSGTLFQNTKIDLPTWFLAISLIGNAKKSLSSCQLARDLGLKQKTAWRMAMKIRIEMTKRTPMLQGIIEADETYIGGKRRKDRDKETGEPRKRGRGTTKDAILGAVSRTGQVVAQLIPDIKGTTIADFIQKHVDIENSELYTDAYKGYNVIGKDMEHHIMNRSEPWVADGIHTNTIEGFWSLVKRAW